MVEEIGSKPIDVQTLENIDSLHDLPDVTELTEEQLYAIRSGDLSSDYIAPFEWDGASYEKWRSIIDGREIGIPDSEDLHARYDFSQYSGTSGFADLSDNNNDLVNGSITGVGASINGRQAGEFDGEDDTIRTDAFSGLSEFTFAFVFEPMTSESYGGDDLHHVIQFGDSDISQRFGWINGEWNLWGSSGATGSEDTGIKIVTGYVYDDVEQILREDGTETGVGNDSRGEATNIGLGSMEPREDGRYAPMAFGEMLIYPGDKTDIFDELESYLDDGWDVGL